MNLLAINIAGDSLEQKYPTVVSELGTAFINKHIQEKIYDKLKRG